MKSLSRHIFLHLILDDSSSKKFRLINVYFHQYMAGMKVYVTDEKELIMEPSVKWAGNPNIIVAIKAFGLRATVQVY